MPSTVYVRYTGRADNRSFTEADFAGKGITDQGDVVFNHDNHWVSGVSPEAAGYLLGTGEFEKTTKEATEPVEEEPVQMVPAPGEAIPGEKQGAHTPHAVQDQPDSQKDESTGPVSSPLAEDYSEWTKADLVAEVELRNETRDPEDQLSKSGNKEDLIAVLQQDNSE